MNKRWKWVFHSNKRLTEKNVYRYLRVRGIYIWILRPCNPRWVGKEADNHWEYREWERK